MKRLSSIKQYLKKPIVWALCAALLVGSAAGVVGTLTFTKDTKLQTAAPAQTGGTATAADSDTKTVDKDETVYVLAGADGSVQKIIVSDWIKNAIGSTTLTDVGTLGDVQNVKGDESYTMNGDNMRVWDAAGNDIYCQGTIEKELPVGMTVTYTLDGAAISPADLAGKSGKVTIRFDYQNRQYETVKIDGKDEKIYVPFAMLTGMLLDSDVFRNVTVSNGKLINDGNHTAVIGIAFPGLQENLALSADKLEIPAYVEITADVKNFEMTNTVTVATNELLNGIDTDKLNTAKDLKNAVDQMTDAMRQLTDGSSKLYAGLTTLLQKSDELVAGIDKLAVGAAALKDGAGAVDEGTAKLLLGLATLCDNNDTLNGGAKQVFETLLASADAQIAAKGLTVDKLTVDGYKATLSALITAPNATQTAQLVGIADTVLEQKLAAAGVPQAQYAAVKFMLYQRIAVQQKTQDAAMQEIVTVLHKANAGDIAALQEVGAAMQAAATADGKKAINGLLLAMAKETLVPTIEGAIASLDEYNKFYTGLAAYTAGVAEAKNGATALKDGTAQLAAGAGGLYDGILQLKNGAPALVDGVSALKDGSATLSDGLARFNKEGVQKLSDAVNGDLAGLYTRLKATVDVSKHYKSFSGITDQMDGQVKFIYRTADISVK